MDFDSGGDYSIRQAVEGESRHDSRNSNSRTNSINLYSAQSYQKD
jgi:hypothetical protein